MKEGWGDTLNMYFEIHTEFWCVKPLKNRPTKTKILGKVMT